MKWSNIQEGKQYRVCSDSVCGTFVAGDTVQKYAGGRLGYYTWLGGLTGRLEKGQREDIDCEVELAE
jgi:hypothetical protein